MTDIFGNILTQMSSAFNNQNKKDNLDIQLNKDKTLKWRGLHNNQFAASKKRGGSAIKQSPSSSPTPSKLLSNGGGGGDGATTVEDNPKDSEPAPDNLLVNDDGDCVQESSVETIKTDEASRNDEEHETKAKLTLTTNQNDSDNVNTDNTNDTTNPTNASNNNNNSTVTSVDNDLIKKENILKYRTRNQRQRRKSLTEADGVDNLDSTVPPPVEVTPPAPSSKSSKKRKITTDTDEVVATPNKIQLRGRKNLSDTIDDGTRVPTPSIAAPSTPAIEEVADFVIAEPKIEEKDVAMDDDNDEKNDILVAGQPTVKPKLKRGRKKKIMTPDITEEKSSQEAKEEFDRQILESLAKVPKKRGRKPKVETTPNTSSTSSTASSSSSQQSTSSHQPHQTQTTVSTSASSQAISNDLVIEKTPTKKSPRASTKENGNNGGILATAIARKEKIYEQILPQPQQRLSRRIKPTAKILANEDLLFGVELQNNARLSLSSENLEDGIGPAIDDKKDDINLLPPPPPLQLPTVQVPPQPHVVRQLDIKTPPSSPPATAATAPVVVVTPPKTKEKIVPKIATPMRKPCPDPEAFLNDIKQNKIALNRSPEDKIKKLNKKQQRRLYKLKEKHLAKLGLKKISNFTEDVDSEEVSDDNDEFIPKQKISVPQKSGVTLRIRNASLSGKPDDELMRNNNKKERRISYEKQKSTAKQTQHMHQQDHGRYSQHHGRDEPPPQLSGRNNFVAKNKSPTVTSITSSRNGNNHTSTTTTQNESSQLSQRSTIPTSGKSNGSKYLCLCDKKSQYYVRKSQEVMQCVAIDQIENHTIGCSNEINHELINLVRPSSRVSYMILCESHRKRLQAHNCCAGCGIFCTQGLYAMCEKNHLLHRDCATKFILNTPFNSNFMRPDDENFTGPTLALKCPHCGSDVLKEDFKIVIKCRESSVFLPFNLKRAKMVFPAENPKHITNTSSTALGARCLNKTLIDIEKLIPETVFKMILSAERSVSNVHINFSHKDLFYAIRDDNPKRVAEIMASGFDITTSFREFQNGTCLHLVSSLGTATIAYLILSKTPSQYFLDLMDNELRTSVMCAVAAEKHDIVKILIQCGADISIKGTDGMTALHIAARRGDLKSTKLLLEHYRQNKNIMKFKAFLDSVDDGHWTALVWAAENGHADIVGYLMSLGADSTVCDTENNVALHWAALSDSVETVVPLLQSDCNINSQNIKGDTPLHISCRQQNTQISLIFLAHGSDLHIKNELNETPYESIVNENSQCARAIRFNINIRNLIKMPKWKITVQDISNGREQYPIQILSNLNITNLEDELDIPDFKYITKTILLQNELQIDQRISQMRICTCTDDCSNDECQCSLISLQNWYSTEGRLKDDFNYEDPAMIFECNDVCGCNKLLCNNRVVQKGIKCRLQVFDSGDKVKGWGVQTLAKILKGSFIAEYTGEILTDSEADRRTDDSYFFDLGSADQHCIDANFYGNVSRFFNHSCDPNVVPVRVYYEHQDLRFPKIAFFASRDIQPGEEITFDYGEKFWIVKFKNFTCHCNSAECKYSKTTITKTLNDYNQRNASSMC